MKLILVIFSLFFCTHSFAQVTFSKSDSSALLKMVDFVTVGAGGPSFLTLNWLPTTPASTWTGIDTIVIADSAYVKTIDLSGLNLASDIQGDIFTVDALQHIEVLDLSDNSIGLSSPLVAITANNSSVEIIDVSNNNFDEFNSGSHLPFLLEGFIGIKQLNASNLYLNSVQGGWNYPTSGTLEILEMNNLSLGGGLTLDSVLNKFQSLKKLSVASNQLSGIAFNSNNATLEELIISNNSINSFAALDNLLNRLSALEVLEANRSLGLGPNSFQLNTPVGALANLRELVLSNNGLSGVLPIGLFQELPNIEVLNLSNNGLTGAFPQPTGTITFNSIANPAYRGLEKIQELDFSANNLEGKLNLLWLTAAQLESSQLNAIPMSLEKFDVSGNNFDEILPALDDNTIGFIRNDPDYANRFSNVEEVNVSRNALDFTDLYRLKEIMRFQRVIRFSTLVSDYIPRAGADSSAFQYRRQDSIGIGGVKRRNQGGSLTFRAGRVPLEEENDGTGTLAVNTTGALYCNVYSWETFDQIGTPSVLGTVELGNYIGGGGPTYRPGGQDAANFSNIGINNMHTLGIVGADTMIHHEKSYSACVTNDSFPELNLCMKKKRVEVGACVDDSGNPVQCQQMIVQFRPGTLSGLTKKQQDSVKQAVRDSLGAKPIDECLCGDIELWEVSDTAMVEGKGSGTKRSTSSARARPQLQSADPNYALMGDANNSLPDTLAIQQGQGNTTATTLVAIIDSGVDYAYPSLQPFISEGAIDGDTCMPDAAWGYNFLDRNNNANDDHGHGTAVAGIVTGLSQRNLLPYTANSPEIGILPLKYTNKKGEGTVFNATCALQYAARYKRVTPSGDTARVRVVNCSWGYYGEPCMVLENAIDYVGQQNCGILIVASAGNDSLEVQGDSTRAHWPSNSLAPNITTTVDNILSVAAITAASSNTLAPYSNYGDVKIDMTAQGTDITTQAGTSTGVAPVNGTSFAAAQVARAAALLFDKYPESSYFAVKFALMNGTDSLLSTDADLIKSGGKLNYQKADSLMNLIIDRTECTESGIIVSIDEVTSPNEQLVQIYPNPMNQTLSVSIDYELSQAYEIITTLYNAQGQLIQHQVIPTGSTMTNMSVGDIPSGIYFLQIQVGKEQWTKKLIKQ